MNTMRMMRNVPTILVGLIVAAAMAVALLPQITAPVFAAGDGNVPVTGVTLDKTDISVRITETETLKATVQPADATNQKVIWSSSDESEATVDQNGVVTGVSRGAPVITVTTEDGGFTAQCQVHVEAAPPHVYVTGITLDVHEITLERGQQYQLNATVWPEDATDKSVDWFVANSGGRTVATVDQNGLVTAQDGGTVYVHARAREYGEHQETFDDSCRLIVPEPVKSVSLNESQICIAPGETWDQLSVGFEPDYATNKNVTWTSAAPDIASIDENGHITGVKEGNTTVTVTSEDGNHQASCDVEVKNNRIAYAVQIYKIDGDAIDFGPAVGACYAHTYVSCHSETHEHCIHTDSWEQIAANVHSGHADYYANCLNNGCTKAVELDNNSELFKPDAKGTSGDGVVLFQDELKDVYTIWDAGADDFSGKYEDSWIKKTLDMMLEACPVTLQKAISGKDVSYMITSYGGPQFFTMNDAKLWLLDENDVAEGKSRIAYKYDGQPWYWWIRDSDFSQHDWKAYAICPDGVQGVFYTNGAHCAVAPGFRIGSSNAEPNPENDRILLAAMKAKAKTGLKLSWNKLDGAEGYDIFFAKYGKGKCKKVKTIKGNKTFKWTKSGLKKKTAYKACVKAYVMKDGKKTYIKTSPLIYAYTGNGTKNCTNAKSVKVNKTKVTLKNGKTFKIKAKVKKVSKNKKLMASSNVKTVRYMTSNSKVATVSSSGKVTARGEGACYVYAYAHNGVSKKIEVTVK